MTSSRPLTAGKQWILVPHLSLTPRKQGWLEGDRVVGTVSHMLGKEEPCHPSLLPTQDQPGLQQQQSEGRTGLARVALCLGEQGLFVVRGSLIHTGWDRTLALPVPHFA